MGEPKTPTGESHAIHAVEFPITYKHELGDRRKRVIQKEAETLLGVDFVYPRVQGSTLFVTADPNDLLAFPKWHEKAGMPRYKWASRGTDGVRLGTLVEGAAGMVGSVDPREE